MTRKGQWEKKDPWRGGGGGSNRFLMVNDTRGHRLQSKYKTSHFNSHQSFL